MSMRNTGPRLLWPIVGAFLAGVPAVAGAVAPPAVTPPAVSQPVASPPSAAPAARAETGGSLLLQAGSGKVLTLNAPAANVFVVNPKVAEVRPASASSLFVFGVGPGQTTLAAMDSNGHVLAQYQITVQRSDFGAIEAEQTIARLLPGNNVKVEAEPKGMLLTGTVKSPQDAAQAVAIAKGYAAENQSIDNEMTITAPVQVTLSVRIAQMSRQVVRNLGVNWSALGDFGTIGKVPALLLNANASNFQCGTGGGGVIPVCPGVNFNGVIDALAKDNLAQVLAEPNLTVMSGQHASFQVGGEYPIPVSQQNNQVTVSYKDFGVMLSFVPTVFSDGRINLHVKPEVSELSNTNSVSLSGGNNTLIVPSLVVRRAETTVELGSGQSFAIAGLLQQSTTDNGQGVPGLGDVPLLGAAFHDNEFSRTETELVIVVTPYIVRPVNNPSALHLPTDSYTPPSDIERLLFMRQVSQNRPPVPVKIPGDAGFMVQ